MKKRILLTSCLFVAALFTGCAQNQVDLNPRVTDSHVIIENPNLYDWLKLEKVNYFTRKDDLLVVEARLKNLSTFNKKVAYKIDWIDENGFTQKSILSKWVVAEVEERRDLIIQGISPSMKIKDFQIRIQVPTSDDSYRNDSYHNQYHGN